MSRHRSFVALFDYVMGKIKWPPDIDKVTDNTVRTDLSDRDECHREAIKRH